MSSDKRSSKWARLDLYPVVFEFAMLSLTTLTPTPEALRPPWPM
jgi:hypothetical protein